MYKSVYENYYSRLATRVVIILISTIGLLYFFQALNSFREIFIQPQPGLLTLSLVHAVLLCELNRVLFVKVRMKRQSYSGLRVLCLHLVVMFLLSCAVGALRMYVDIYFVNWKTQINAYVYYLYTVCISFMIMAIQLLFLERQTSLISYNPFKIHENNGTSVEMQVKLDRLKAQLQPHFLFNSLNTLIGLIETNKKNAVCFTQDLAFVYRYLLESNASTLINLSKELDFSEVYFSLLKTRHPEGLELVIEANGADAFQLPPLCIQLLVENAVKHNLVTRQAPLHIFIYLDSRKERLIVQNNYQPKPKTDTTGKGLTQLNDSFIFLGLAPPRIIVTETDFIVTINLVKK